MSTDHSFVEVRSPGRINLIGEHTDYNGGFVLPAAIDKQVTVRMERNGSEDACLLRAKNLSETFEFSLNKLARHPGGWQNYALGVVHEFQKLGLALKGFNADIEGNVPIGSGMSSSAAFECSVGFALNATFGLGLSKMDLIYAAQRAEHHYVGTKCGIMDMFASVMGKAGHFILLDCRSLAYDYFPLDLGEYELLLLNSNVSHSLADSAYNTRRQECEEGVAFFHARYPDVTQLRDVTPEMLEREICEMPAKIGKRCRHVVLENQRVLEATRVLSAGDLLHLGELMYASHLSLKDDYEVSCPELDFLVEQTVGHSGVLGSRMMGGGFGGCTLNLIRSQDRDMLVQQLSEAYQREFNRTLIPYRVRLADGTGFLHA